MRKFLNPFRGLLARAQRRFVGSRPGSVLILVITLLVLMALIGTAFMTSARSDRYSAQQHVFNTQIDLLVKGVVEMTKSAILADRSSFTAPTIQSFLGDRLPMVTTPASATYPVYWNNVTGPIHSGGVFASPYTDNSGSHPEYYPLVPTAQPNGGSIIRQFFNPTSLTLTNSTGAAHTYPAMMVIDPATPAGPRTFLTASASGDGIADCGLVKLPMGPINGVTYYYGTRIIENNSAINASTAWERNAPYPGKTYDFSTRLPGDFFPSNIGLRDLLVNPALELQALNQYRFNPPSPTVFDVTQSTYWDTTVDEFGAHATRADLIFVSPYDALWQQLGRRLRSPGLNATNGPFRALGIGDSATLGYRFCLANPQTVGNPAAWAPIEKLMPASLMRVSSGGFATVRSAPYAADQVAQWYNENFDYAGETAPNNLMPRRVLMTTRNPVTNLVPTNSIKLFNLGQFWTTPKTYVFGEAVKNPIVNGGVLESNFTYVCIRDHNSTIDNSPNSPNGPLYWAVQPWMDKPTKTSINTATFDQLQLAFWSTMYTPINALGGGLPDGNQNFAFRSPLRSPNALLPANVCLRLRAALAAINAVGMRDSSDDVQSREINVLGADPANPTGPAVNYRIMVYGNEMQPYITEVYGTSRGGAPGYVAVELHNPYDFPITLANWRLATINRPATAAVAPPYVNPDLLPGLVEIGNAETGTWLPSLQPYPITLPVIQPHQFLVLASAATPPNGVAPTTAQAGGTGIVPPLFVIPDLALALDHELILLKPRAASGVLTAGTDPRNTYSEPLPTVPVTTPALLAEMVPVDSYDFTGLNLTNPPTDWHYVRPSAVPGAPSKAWHFVYPGAYGTGFGASSAIARLIGTDTTTLQTSLATFGNAEQTAATSAYVDRPLQMNNRDFGGPNKLQTTGNAFPFGTFARNGDILQVPFVGSYRIYRDDPAGTAPPTLYELTPVAMDTAFADDGDATDDLVENIGRFTPIHPGDLARAALSTAPDVPGANTTSAINDYSPVRFIGAVDRWRYHWAMSLFDYITVQAPSDDYSPNVPDRPGYRNLTGFYPPPVPNVRASVDNTYIGNPDGTYINPKSTAPPPNLLVNYIPNANPNTSEELAPIEGLINLNTASVTVLATLPMSTAAADNLALAQEIVKFRDVDDSSGVVPPQAHGPFRSIFELNMVPRFRDLLGTYVFNGVMPRDDNAGDISPLNAPITYPLLAPPAGFQMDQVQGDFEWQYLMMNRISNLVTTRSDSFTAYIVVQGWRNAGTNNPELVVQRRAAFILDRSAYNAAKGTPPTVINLQTE